MKLKITYINGKREVRSDIQYICINREAKVNGDVWRVYNNTYNGVPCAEVPCKIVKTISLSQ